LEGFIKHQLFIAGLKEDIRMKVMEAGKPSIQDSVPYARELEVIHEDRKKGSTVGNIKAQDNNDDNLDDKERAAVNAIRLLRQPGPTISLRKSLTRTTRPTTTTTLLGPMQILQNPRSPSEGLWQKKSSQSPNG
jgi:hypothetical protein